MRLGHSHWQCGCRRCDRRILFDNNDPFDLSITGSAVVPSVSTTLAIGQLLRDHIGEGITVILGNQFRSSTKLVDPNLTNTIADFSSRGASRENRIKPDITAPGVTIFSVGALTGNQGTTIDGTSMASPHTAGSLALLKQLHPAWTPEEIKALLMNTANTDIRSDLPAASALEGPTRQGAGRITLPGAAVSQVIAYNADGSGTVSASFGAIEVVNTTTVTGTLNVANKGATAQTFNRIRQSARFQA